LHPTDAARPPGVLDPQSPALIEQGGEDDDVRFRVLGPVEMWDEGQQLPVTGIKPRTVLAALVLNANQPVTPERLIDLTWGASPTPSARRVLHQYVSLLRRLLRGHDLVRETAGYVLRAPEETIDAARFSALTTAGRAALAAGDPAAAATLLDQGLCLWRGPALSGVTHELVAVEGPPLEERRIWRSGGTPNWSLNSTGCSSSGRSTSGCGAS
jgi:hypothetical protein